MSNQLRDPVTGDIDGLVLCRQCELGRWFISIGHFGYGSVQAVRFICTTCGHTATGGLRLDVPLSDRPDNAL